MKAHLASRSASPAPPKSSRKGHVCACCAEELGILNVGEKVLAFRPCQHFAHQECLVSYASERHNNDTSSAILSCPRCATARSKQRMAGTDTPELSLALSSKRLPSTPTIASGSSSLRSQQQLVVRKASSRFLLGDGDASDRISGRTDGSYFIPKSATKLAHQNSTPILSLSCDHTELNRDRTKPSNVSCLISIESPLRSVKDQLDQRLNDTRRLEANSLYSIVSSYASPPSSLAESRGTGGAQYSSTATSREKLHELQERSTNWNGVKLCSLGKLLLWDSFYLDTTPEETEYEGCLFERAIILFRVVTRTRRFSTQVRYLVEGSVPVKQIRRVQTANLRLYPAMTIIMLDNKALLCRFKDMTSRNRWLVRLKSQLDSPPVPSASHLQLVRPSAISAEKMISYRSVRAGTSRSTSSRFSNINPSLLKDSHLSGRSCRKALPHLPLDLIIIVPTNSGSAAIQLDILKDSLASIVELLGEYDRLGLIACGSSTPSMAEKLSLNDKFDTDTYLSVVEQLFYAGESDVVNEQEIALELAVGMLKKRLPRPCITHLIYLSSTPEVTGDMQRLAQSLNSSQAILHTLGFDLLHDSEGMAVLSAMAYGTYSHVDDTTALEDYMVRTVLGIMSVTHTDVMVNISIPPCPGVPSFCTINGFDGCTDWTVSTDRQSAQVWLPYLCHGEKLEVIVNLHLDPVRIPFHMVELLQAKLSFRNISSQKYKIRRLKTSYSLTVPVGGRTTENFHKPLVVRTLEIVVGDAAARAMLLMSKDKIDATVKLLTECRLTLVRMSRVHNFKETDYIWDLDTDLARLLEYTESSETFFVHGRRLATGMLMALTNQRSWSSGSVCQKRYAMRLQLNPQYGHF